jgi:hypothetical protein
LQYRVDELLAEAAALVLDVNECQPKGRVLSAQGPPQHRADDLTIVDRCKSPT